MNSTYPQESTTANLPSQYYLKKLDDMPENVTAAVPQENIPLCPASQYEPEKQDGVIRSVTTTVDMGLEDPPPRDHIIWSLFTMTYMNLYCCGLGMLPVAFSIKSRDRKYLGDMDGARHYGATAKYLNIAAPFLLLIPGIILIVVLTSK